MERPVFQDKKIKCVDCGAQFVWEQHEQFYFWSKNLATPKRCPECRERRKLTIAPEGARYG